ncbi:MAG: hypothetical protein QM582_06200 [Micropruina sp.]|uniref:hypothetical protein n=1 Tax=Micropruina sp. TaxID=2737536 RepID=UPI0039E4068C
MDISLWVMVVVIGWTVLGLVLVAVLWSRAPWKAVLAWLGIALVPIGIWLVGLSQAAIDGWNTLALWWQGLVYTLPVLIGLSVLGLAAVLLLISRLVPHRPRRRKPKDEIPSAAAPPMYRPAAPRSEAEQTLILPENRPNP